MKRAVVGMVAHVDAGKTTTIEGMLYQSGAISSWGRVDDENAFLDYDKEERAHGITIYAKEAHLEWKDTEIYLIDTPGHVDFVGETERCLQVLDMAVLILNAKEMVQSHTKTIFEYLRKYHIPTIIYLNKMDLTEDKQEDLIQKCQEKLHPQIMNWEGINKNEQLALIQDTYLEEYTKQGSLKLDTIIQAFNNEEFFPCLFGTSLKQVGITELMDAIVALTEKKEYPTDFGARVFQITYDQQNQRLVHVKMTGGELKVKQQIHEDKVDQIRLIHGNTFQSLEKASAGMIVALKGLNHVSVGQGLGIEDSNHDSLVHPCFTYELNQESSGDFLKLMSVCKELFEQDPLLQMDIHPENQKITFSLMGDLQLEILAKKILERSGIEVSFNETGVLYQETITQSVVGVGHYEPLKHYAEVQLLLEPISPKEGIVVDSICPSEDLPLVYQKGILSILEDTTWKGVSLGAPLTGLKVTLLTGKYHVKHTEGGDFREATTRALRQGLMQVGTILLEPYAEFEITMDYSLIGQVLYELEKIQIESPTVTQNENEAIISGKGPMQNLIHFQKDYVTRQKQIHSIHIQYCGYDTCLDMDKVKESSEYEALFDQSQPSSSIFFSHGEMKIVPWNEVGEYIDVVQPKKESKYYHQTYQVSAKELSVIVDNSGGKNRNPHKVYAKEKEKEDLRKKPSIDQRPELYVIDGYNLLYEMEVLKDLAKEDLWAAREKLIDRLYNYIAYYQKNIILVFDGYQVQNHSQTDIQDDTIHIVYTKTGETADAYIARMANVWVKKYRLTVISSDALIQNAIFSQGALRMSSRLFAKALDEIEM